MYLPLIVGLFWTLLSLIFSICPRKGHALQVMRFGSKIFQAPISHPGDMLLLSDFRESHNSNRLR
ncbi:hypothetical protein BDV33DRAFT_168247, partial [Aspergillus novoparasiticus]